MKPPVWFERPIDRSLADHVARRVAPIISPDDSSFSGLEQAFGVIAGSRRYDAELMNHAPRVVAIARTGIGVDTVDLDEATRRGIAVCNAPDGPTISTAEHAVMLLLMASKRSAVAVGRLRSGERELYGRNRAVEIADKMLGLVGGGRIARRVATAAMALGMRVQIYDPYVAAMPEGAIRCDSLARLLASSDAVSVHVPLTAETRHMFDRKAFAAMRPGAVFVNTARGGLVDQEALLWAVDSGHLFGAGIDVTEPEPLPPDHPLLAHDHIIVTPHVASGTSEGKRKNFTMALDQVIEIAQARRPSNLVNPEAWERVVARCASEWGQA